MIALTTISLFLLATVDARGAFSAKRLSDLSRKVEVLNTELAERRAEAGVANNAELQQLFPNIRPCIDTLGSIIGQATSVALECLPLIDDIEGIVAGAGDFQNDVCANDELQSCKASAIDLVATGIDSIVICVESLGLGDDDEDSSSAEDGDVDVNLWDWLAFAADLKTCQADAIEQFVVQERNAAAGFAPRMLALTVAASLAVVFAS